MRKFGAYETVQEIFRGGLGSVFSARPEGTSGNPTHAVKTCEPVAEILGEDQARAAVEAFADAVEVQRRAAAAGGGHWAPVHDFERTPYGAFYVTDLFERGSLERIFAGRVRLDARTLGHLVGSVVAGLRELDGACGRAHGNLRATNVLVSGGEGLADARIALSDPGPDRGDEGRTDDLKDLGRLIYQGVLHQPVHEGLVLPLPPSAAWAGLGKAGEGWRELCSKLLAGDGSLTLDGVAAEIERLGAIKSGGSKGLMIAAAAAVVVVGGVAAVVVPRLGGGGPAQPVQEADPGFKIEDWKELCGEYRAWFAAFERDVSDARVRSGLERDAHLRGVLMRLEGAKKSGVEFDPLKVAGLPAGTTLQSLVREDAEAPERAKTANAVKGTAAALEAIRGVRAALTAEAWPTLGRVAATAEAFGERGWGAAKTVLDVRVRDVEIKPGAKVADALGALLEAAEAASGVETRWERIAAIAEQLKGTGDAVLARFESWALASGGAASAAGAAGLEALAELERRLGDVEAVGARLAAFVKPGGEWGGIDQELFAAESKVHKDVRGGVEVTAATFEDWLVQVRGYQSLDPALDPRAKWASVDLAGGPLGTGVVRGPEALREVLRHQRALAEELKTEIDPASATKMEELRATLDQLAGLSWNRTNQARITELEQRATATATQLAAALGKQVEDARLERAQGWQDVVANLRGRDSVVAGAADSALNVAWRRWRDGVLAEVTPAGGGVGDIAELRRRARAVEEVVRSLDEALPREGPKIAVERPWAAALAAAAAAERERLLAGLVERLGASAPAAEDAALVSAVEAMRAEHAAASERLGALAADCAALEGLLDHGYGLGETPLNGGATGAELAGRMRQMLATFGSEVSAAIRPVLSRVESLEAIAQGTDKQALARIVGQARADRPEEAVNAWRRLGELSWPAGTTELEQELALRQTLSRLVGLVEDPARRSALEGELAAQARERWERGVAGLREIAAIEAAIAGIEAWGLRHEHLRDPRVRFNASLHRLRAALRDPALSDEAALEEAKRFLGAVAELPPEVQGSAQELVAGLTALLREVEGAEAPPRPDIAKLGPGAVPGWTGEELDGGAMAVYRRETPEGPLELRFVAVQVPGEAGGEPRTVYLAETELSLRQFMAIVGAEGKWSEAVQLLGADVPRGPAVWKADAGRIVRNTYWTTPHPMITDQRPAFAPGLGDPGDKFQVSREQGPPAGEMPMQQISAAAAVFVARLTGCRLPTSGEWLAGLESLGTAAEEAGWNLRDMTWQTQHAHVRRIREELTRSGVRGGITAFQWPDEGIFEPLRGDAPTGERATALTSSDGRLFFAPVDSMPQVKLQHLVGNVAEFVFEDPEAISGLARGDAAAVEDVVASGGLRVIGGSALSPPQIDVRIPEPVDEMDVLTPFSDVGVRLAFDAGTGVVRERLAARVSRLAGPERYLAGGR